MVKIKVGNIDYSELERGAIVTMYKTKEDVENDSNLSTFLKEKLLGKMAAPDPDAVGYVVKASGNNIIYVDSDSDTFEIISEDNARSVDIFVDGEKIGAGVGSYTMTDMQNGRIEITLDKKPFYIDPNGNEMKDRELAWLFDFQTKMVRGIMVDNYVTMGNFGVRTLAFKYKKDLFQYLADNE